MREKAWYLSTPVSRGCSLNSGFVPFLMATNKDHNGFGTFMARKPSLPVSLKFNRTLNRGSTSLLTQALNIYQASTTCMTTSLPQGHRGEDRISPES